MTLVWTPEAKRDLIDVQTFIAADNPRAAARMGKLLLDTTARLGDFPMLGHAGQIPGTRELISPR